MNAAVEQRQADCEHKFIKGLADSVAMCAMCGLSKPRYEKALEDAQTAAANAYSIGGFVP